MAYHQPNHDPYYSQPVPNYHAGQDAYHNQAPHSPHYGNTGVADYPPVQHNGYDEYDQHSNWETKSAKSFTSSYAGSQAHLAPYEMSQPAPPVPTMPYQPQQNYPPQARPGMYHHPSSAGYSVAREKMLKRRSVRQVELFQGNLVLDMDVPTHIVPSTRSHEEEMTKMRYTAATCDPDDFMGSRYSLRPYLLGRQTELFIVMTMYNEDEVLFCKTMNA